MLEKVRKPSRARSLKSVIAYTLFALICFSFVFLGLTPDRGSNFDHGGAAAYVNNVIISIADFRERLQYYERQAGERFDQLPAAQRQEVSKEMRGRVLRDLIESQLNVQAANKAGIFASDAAVRDQLVNMPFFQEDGRFDRSRYDNALSGMRMTAGEFERKLRAEVVEIQLRQLFFKVMKNTSPVQALDHQLRETKINLDVVQIDPAKLKGAAPSEAEAKAFLASTEGKNQVGAYYESNKSEFTGRAEVQASHILIKPKGNDWDGALKAIQKIKKEAQKEDFGQLAAKVSEDEGSKGRNGDLGFFGRGQMAKEFEDAAFTQPIGQIGEPVKTQFGYHLIKVADRRGGEVKPLAEVELQIAKTILVKSAADRFIANLEGAVKEGKPVDALMAQQNLKWQETGDFDLSSRFVPKIGEHSAIINAALALKKAGEISRQVVHSNGQAFLVRMKSIKMPPAEKANQSFAFSMGAKEVLDEWARQNRENSKIRMNEGLLQ